MKIGGKTISNWWVIGGGGGVVLLWFLYRKSSSGSTSTTATGSGSTVTDPVTGQTYPATGVDPATGMTYAQEISEFGGVSAAESALSTGSAYGLSGGYGGYGGTAGYPTSNVGTTTTTTAGYSTNAQWAQAVQAGLAGLGYDPTTVASALGLYLTNMPLNATDTSIIQAAVAEYGPPPVGSFAIIQQGNGTGSGTTTTVPSGLVGDTAGDAHNKIVSANLIPVADPGQKPTDIVTSTSPAGGTQVSAGTNVLITAKATAPSGGGGTTHPSPPAAPRGVSASGVGSRGFTVHWGSSSDATGYRVRITYQSQLVHQQNFTSTSGAISGLTPDHTYGVHVAATGSGGTSSETSISVKTTK